MDRREARVSGGGDNLFGRGSYLYETKVLSGDTVKQAAGSAAVGAGIGYAIEGAASLLAGAETGLLAYGGYVAWKEYDYYFGDDSATNAVDKTKYIEEKLAWIAAIFGKNIDLGTASVGRQLVLIKAFSEKYGVEESTVANDYNAYFRQHGYSFDNVSDERLEEWALAEDAALKSRATKGFFGLHDPPAVPPPVTLHPVTEKRPEISDIDRLQKIVLAAYHKEYPNRTIDGGSFYNDKAYLSILNEFTAQFNGTYEKERWLLYWEGQLNIKKDAPPRQESVLHVSNRHSF